MTRIENRQNVSKIIMWPTAYVKCKIGQDWYKCAFEVHYVPSNAYPDYMEVDSYIKENIDGSELNIEEAAKKLYDFLMRYYPSSLKVINHISGCKTHFDVDVVVE